jgi:hypothetical protein
VQLLSATAALISTAPPDTDLQFFPYTRRISYILSLGSFVMALDALLCGLAVVNTYEACETDWAKTVGGKPGITLTTIHTIAGFDGHAFSVVCHASIAWLAVCIARFCYHPIDVV